MKIKVKVRPFGTYSYAITIPKNIVREMGISVGDILTLTMEQANDSWKKDFKKLS